MAAHGHTYRLWTGALLVAIVVILVAPPTAGIPPPAPAPLPLARSTDGSGNGASSLGVATAVGATGLGPPGTAGRDTLHAGNPFRGTGGSSGSSGAELTAAAKKGPGYLWGSAYVFYAPTDPQTLLFGQGTGLAVDNALDEFAFFGGLASGGLSNITLRYYWWYNVSDPANSSEGWGYTNSPTSPSARTNLSMAAYQAGGVALLFGGLTSTTTQRTANDTWIYSYGRDTWTNVTQANGTARPAPPPREEAALAVDQKDGIALLFGGIAPEFTAQGSTGSVIWQDTWVFHFRTDRWTEVSPTTVPPGRYGASMVWDSRDDEFLMVGGCALACAMDAWALTRRRWTGPRSPRPGRSRPRDRRRRSRGTPGRT